MALTATDLFIVGRAAVNYKITADALADFVFTGSGKIGLGLNVTGNIVKVSIPVASTPPAAGALAAQAIDGSLYWDDNLTQLFIRYNNNGNPVWVAAAPSAGGGGGGVTSVTGTLPIVIAGTATAPDITINAATAAAPGSIEIATLAEAATGTDATRASTPETAVPKDSAGMAGAALLPGSAAAYVGTPAMGMIRYNDAVNPNPPIIEYYDATAAAWVPLIYEVTGSNGITATGSAATSFGSINVTLPINLLPVLP